MRAWEKKRRKADSTKDSWTFFFLLLVSHRLWAGRACWSRVVVKKIVYSEWWLLRTWLTTVCWKVFDIFSFDSSNRVEQENILIFLTSIQQPQELRVPFRSDGSHICLSDTVKDFIFFVRFQFWLCLEKALWTHFISPAKKGGSSLL